MALDVKVTINLANPIGKVGSWYPLVYVIKGDDEQDMYKEYADISEVQEDFEVETEAYKVASLIFSQTDAPSKLAICRGVTDVMTGLTAHMKKSWRQLVVISEFDKTVAQGIESAKDKMYFTHFASVDALNAAAKDMVGYKRTVAVVYNNEEITSPEAAVVGAISGLVAGSYTCKNMIIKGVPAIDFTDAELTSIHDAGGITIVEKAGDIVTSEGIVVSGEYVDIVDSEDSIIQNIKYKTQKVFNGNKKVPYTDGGIALLEAATLEALVNAYNNGMISDKEDGTPDYSVSFAMRNQTTESDRATRSYPYGKFAFRLAGAIHTGEIVGEVTY